MSAIREKRRRKEKIGGLSLYPARIGMLKNGQTRPVGELGSKKNIDTPDSPVLEWKHHTYYLFFTTPLRAAKKDCIIGSYRPFDLIFLLNLLFFSSFCAGFFGCAGAAPGSFGRHSLSPSGFFAGSTKAHMWFFLSEKSLIIVVFFGFSRFLPFTFLHFKIKSFIFTMSIGPLPAFLCFYTACAGAKRPRRPFLPPNGV